MPQKTPFALEYIRALRDDRTLTTTEKLTAVFMASHAGHDGTNAHPGHKLTGDETATSERTSKRTVASLVEKGWLIQTNSGRGNNRYASVYRLAIPQSATGGTLDGPTGQTGQAKVPNETGQGAISDSQSATGGPTNQPVEITLEIPVSQISDLTDRQGKNDHQRLTDGAAVEPTGQEGSPSADGEAGDGWEDYQSGEELVSDLNEVLEFKWPREDFPDAEPFDPRFLRGGAKRLDELVRAVNKHQFDMWDLYRGMFSTPHESFGLGLGTADHNSDMIEDPAKFFTPILSGPLSEIVVYGLRGRKINAAVDAHMAARERAERDLWDSTEAERAKILATMPRYVPPRARPLAGAHFRTWFNGPGSSDVSVWRHPEFDVVFAGSYGKCPGPDWEHGYMFRYDWDEIKDQDVIPLRQAQAA